MKLPTLYAVLTERGTLAFDGEGDPVVFTRPYRALAACKPGERTVACVLHPTEDPRLAFAASTKPYAE